jgi:sarcosine oxidase
MSLAGFTPSSAAIHSPEPVVSGGRSAGQTPDVVVIGAGNFGIWTSFYLSRLGADVTVIDKYGPGNSRSTSGGETRGVRSSYGGRPNGLLWNRWANEAMTRWAMWDEEWGRQLLPKLFFNTGDLIMRPEMMPYIEDTMADWDTLGVPYELLDQDEIRYRWPVIGPEQEIGVGLYEPQAGVVRARRAIEAVAEVFRKEGGDVTLAAAELGERDGRQLNNVALQPGGSVSASQFVFACGPWFPKVFPELMGKRLRISMGNTFYFAVPPGDNSYSFPNLPSYGVPGVTGWPALGRDHRGFRVRTGGKPPQDPDISDRWIPKELHERPRQLLREWFPGLADMPINETRSCHYESSVSRNFIIDKHPDFDNVWLAGGGSAESFKQGPVLGEYIARRVMGLDENPELAEGFKLSEEEFGDARGRRRG